MPISDQKSELRTRLLFQRKSMSDEVWEFKSDQIIGNLNKLNEFKKSQTIHCFVSMNDRKEVNTHDLIKELLSQNKEVIVPITDFETGELKNSKLKSLEELQPNKWGVLEPAILNSFRTKIDIILVPLLAADKHFNRLGYGKGFYDRFLKSASVLKVGLVFEEFILSQIPIEDFDEKLDILITEKKILRRNNSEFVS